MRYRLITALLVCLSACSGGGGGGGGGSDNGASGSGSASRGVRVLHGAIDGSPIDLTSSLSPTGVLQSVSFAASPGYVELPTGEQLLDLTLRGSLGESIKVPVTVEGKERRSVLIFEGSGEDNYGATLILDEIGIELESGTAAVRVVHSVRGGGRVSATVGTTALAGTVALGESGAYSVVPVGTQAVTISSEGSGVIATESFNFESEKIYTLFVVGEVGYLVLLKQLER